MIKLSFSEILDAFRLLDRRLAFRQAPHFNLVVCGGAALMATRLVERTTKDVDVVALLDGSMHLVDPEPLPAILLEEAGKVALDLDLDRNWLNNGPSKGDGGLFRSGLPEGFVSRLTRYEIGEHLTLHLIGRYDQIHFKLFAAVDRFGGYHAEDMRKLTPTDEELLAAARWSMTQDPSEGYRQSLQRLMEHFGYGHLSQKI
jgi:hypothetical protein